MPDDGNCREAREELRELRDRLTRAEGQVQALKEVVEHFFEGSTTDRQALHRDVALMRDKYHEQFEMFSQRVAPWVSWVFGVGGAVMGGMFMWILNHAGGGR